MIRNKGTWDEVRNDYKVRQVRALKSQIKRWGLPAPEEEVRFHPSRKWKFDLCWRPPIAVAVEYEGGTWGQSRHTSGIGYRNDAEKYSEAAILGWLVVRITADMIKDETGVDMVSRAYWTRKGA